MNISGMIDSFNIYDVDFHVLDCHQIFSQIFFIFCCPCGKGKAKAIDRERGHRKCLALQERVGHGI